MVQFFKKKKEDNKFDDRWTLIEKTSDTYLYKCKTTEINPDSFVNWNKNRPPDEIRILQIKEYFSENNVEIVPGVIYAWLNNEKLCIYDGIHRFLAALRVNKPLTFLLQIKISEKENDIINDFLNLNKSVNVPSIYMEEGNVMKRLVCQNVAKMMCDKYPSFVSPSRKPYIYNFNRDNLIEFISSFEIDFTKSNIDLLIFNELIGLNYVAQDFVKNKGINCPKKCDFNKFYLFYLDKNLIRKQIEKQLQ